MAMAGTTKKSAVTVKKVVAAPKAVKKVETKAPMKTGWGTYTQKATAAKAANKVTPVVEKTAKPVVKKTVVKKTVVKKTVAKKVIAKKPVAKKVVAKAAAKPAVKAAKPAVKKPVVKKPVAKK